MKGIIFDLNGVLWWDSDLQECAWSDMAATLRGLPLSDNEIAVYVHGRTNRHTLEYLTGRTLQGDELMQLTQHKERIYRQLCLDQGAAFALSPGAVDLLDVLVMHQIPRTIATASEKTNLDFFIAHLHLDRWFDVATIVYDDGTRPGKPAPDIYLRAAHQLRLAPADCIVVEDSHSGIQAAHAAGIGMIIAVGPCTKHQHLAQLAGVSAVIENLQQFPAEPITDPRRIADFLELRLQRHPKMIRAILRSEGLPAQPSRADLEAYARKLAMVIIRPG